MSIHRLPDELILEVLILHLGWRSSKPKCGRSYWKGFRTFLFVCRRWYEIATGCPRLWTFVDLSSPPDCIQAMLKWSRDMPLHVQPTHPAPHLQSYDPGSIVRIMQERNRIEYLELFITEEVAIALRPLSSQPIPLCIIRVLIVYNEVADFTDSIPFPFDPSLSTSFCALHVEGFMLERVSRAFHLEAKELVLSVSDEGDITNQIEDDNTGENEEEQVIRKSLLYRLMQGINTMPHLEVLEVRSHLPTTLVPIKSALILNQLRVLSLSLEATDLNLLKRISSPSGVSLQLTICHNFLSADLFSSVLCTTTDFVTHGTSPLRIKTLILHPHDPYHLLVKFWPRIMHPNKIDTPYSDSTCIELNFETHNHIDFIVICTSIAENQLISELDTLVLPFEPMPHSITTVHFLYGIFELPIFDSLRVFIAKDWPTIWLLKLLSIKSESRPSQYIFPNLREVVTKEGTSDSQQWRVTTTGFL